MTKWKPDGTWHVTLHEFSTTFHHETHIWCLHCERAAPIAEWDRCDRCPYPGCDGSFIDAWAWSTFAGDPRFPPVPVEGQVYLLYPDA